MKVDLTPIPERRRCRDAANVMLFLCLMNIAPVLLLTAMGMAGAAVVQPERNFSTARAMVTGLLILGLPLVVAQVWVRRGAMGAILFGLVFELLLLGFLVFLTVSVADAQVPVQFKLLVGILSVGTMLTYTFGIFRLLAAARETRRRAPGSKTGG